MQRFKALFGVQQSPQLHPYVGYGSPTRITVLGRVTESIGDRLHQQSEGSLTHAWQVLRSYIARPLANQKIEIAIGNQRITATTDASGVFTSKSELNETEYAPGWQVATARVLDTAACTSTLLPFYVADPAVDTAIISDIDDTIIVSNATARLRLLYGIFFKSAIKRPVWSDAKTLLKTLSRPTDSHTARPVFYVSSSHWNLYEPLRNTLRYNKLPPGPLLLKRTSSLRSIITTTGRHHHKQEAIEAIFATYPHWQFILLGDSGQQDQEIYSQLATDYPAQVAAIYIRDIAKKPATASHSQVGETPLVIAPEAATFIEHAETPVAEKHLAKD